MERKIMIRLASRAAAASLLGFVAACAGTGADYTPVVDGAPSASFDADLAACRDVARKKALIDGETRQSGTTSAPTSSSPA